MSSFLNVIHDIKCQNIGAPKKAKPQTKKKSLATPLRSRVTRAYTPTQRNLRLHNHGLVVIDTTSGIMSLYFDG